MNEKELIKGLQVALNKAGERLNVDGVFGPLTEQAAFQYQVDIFVTRLPPDRLVALTPIGWARTQVGVKEKAGKEDNPIIAAYHQHSTNLKGYQPDEVPWCSSFLNAAADHTGMEKTGVALAISWRTYGDDTGDKVGEGDIVVLRSSVGSGHVTLANKSFSRTQNKTFEGIGGNQGNEVNVTSFLTANIISTRKWVSKKK